MLSLLALCVLGGSAVGLLSGMFGVGGAFIIIPLLDEILLRLGMDPSISHLMAVGTSPSTVLFTCVASFMAHRRLGAMRNDILFRMCPGIGVGAILGAFLAPLAPTVFLKLLFYSIIVVVCGQMAFPMKGFEREKEDVRHLLPVSVFFGVLASMSGVAGTFLNVTYLSWRGVPWAQAVCTGAGIGLIISITATTGYIWSGWDVPGLPEWSLGYVYLPGTLCLIVPSMLMARFGAWLIHWKKMPVALLKRGVGLFLVLFALSQIVRILWELV